VKRFLAWAAGLAVLVGVASSAWIRLAPSDAAWHVDPMAAAERNEGNSWLVGPPNVPGADAPAPVYDVSAEALARAVDQVATAAGARVLEGSPSDLWTTYVKRSRWIGFPDYVSVRTLPLGEDSATLAIFSRSRFGSDDLGVNRERVGDWLSALASLEE
jgi:uncharacterized protein (DUF1499 family)